MDLYYYQWTTRDSHERGQWSFAHTSHKHPSGPRASSPFITPLITSHTRPHITSPFYLAFSLEHPLSGTPAGHTEALPPTRNRPLTRFSIGPPPCRNRSTAAGEFVLHRLLRQHLKRHIPSAISFPLSGRGCRHISLFISNLEPPRPAFEVKSFPTSRVRSTPVLEPAAGQKDTYLYLV